MAIAGGKGPDRRRKTGSAGGSEVVGPGAAVQRGPAACSHGDATTRATGQELQILVQAALSGRVAGEGVGVLIGRLDRADLITEVLGPEFAEAVADELVVQVAGAVRSADTVGRFGRHGWYALVEGVPSWRDLELVVERVVASSRRPAVRPGHPDHLMITTSVGAAVTHDPLTSPSALLGRADRACREASAAGGDRYHRAHEWGGDGLSRLELAHDLHRALACSEFEVAVQAMVPVRSGTAIPGPGRFEALVRWNHPLRGALHPTVFGPVALGLGLGTGLGTAILGLVCREIAAMARRGEPATLSVDVDPRWFAGSGDDGIPAAAGMVERVSTVVAASGIDPRHLHLELDARQLMACGPDALDGLARLPAMGVGLVLDHLVPSLSALEWLVVNPDFMVWKLDRCVAEHLVAGTALGAGRGHDPGLSMTGLARAGLEAATTLARSRGIETVALGVDRPEIAPALAGVDRLQGFAVERPERVGAR